MISIAIPVGPNPVYKEYLAECLESVSKQRMLPKQVIIIDDQAKLDSHKDIYPYLDRRIQLVLWGTPWLSGVAHAFNFGVALATQELVLMLGSDDKLNEWAVNDCVRTYRAHPDPLGYYYLDVEYSDGRGVQNLPCNAAMVHKNMWKASGGFPVESAIGQPDTMLISILYKHSEAGHLIHVESNDKPPYWYRVHAGTVTSNYKPGLEAVFTDVRDCLTATWTKPSWT